MTIAAPLAEPLGGKNGVRVGMSVAAVPRAPGALPGQRGKAVFVLPMLFVDSCAASFAAKHAMRRVQERVFIAGNQNSKRRFRQRRFAAEKRRIKNRVGALIFKIKAPTLESH